MLNYYQTNNFVKNVWHIWLSLFTLGPIVLKQFTNTLTSLVHLFRWCRCNTSECGARGPGFGSRLWKRIFMFALCFVVVVVFTYVFKTFFTCFFFNFCCIIILFIIIHKHVTDYKGIMIQTQDLQIHYLIFKTAIYFMCFK